MKDIAHIINDDLYDFDVQSRQFSWFMLKSYFGINVLEILEYAQFLPNLDNLTMNIKQYIIYNHIINLL